MGAVADRVAGVLTSAVAGRGLDLESVEVQPAGRRRVVRVLVDRDDGISLDDVADLSHYLSDVLDDSDAMGDQPYVLEVSSPGVDRPLTLPRHWRRAHGRLVTASLVDGTVVSGRVLDSTETDATIATAEGSRSLRFVAVAEAHLEVEFRHPAADGAAQAGND